MRTALFILGGFVAGTALVVGAMAAVPRTTSGTVNGPARSATSMHMAMGSSMASGSAMTMAHQPLADKLTIQHVKRGCHVWSNGTTRASMMRLHLKAGQRLTILDQDVDPHQLLQLAGPAHLRLGRPMMMNHSTTLVFPRTGV